MLNPERSGDLFVPVQRNAFGSPDRDLIEQFDNGRLSKSEMFAFEKTGIITLNSMTSVMVGTLENMSLGSTDIGSKKEKINYKKLQKSKYEGLDIDWGLVLPHYFTSTFHQDGLGADSRRLPIFTVLFE